MTPADADTKKRVIRKLTKKRREGHHVTMEIPEKFKDGDDADEDVTAPRGQNIHMNQSVFGMIAAAGSQVDFNARFDGQSSDDEDAPGDSSSREESVESTNKPSTDETSSARSRFDKHRRKLSEHKLLRSLPHLSVKGSKSKSETSKATSPGGPESPSIEVTPTHPRGRPVMSRMLEAEAKMSSRPSFELPRRPAKTLNTVEETGSSNLAIRLMEIFEFEKPEEVIEG